MDEFTAQALRWVAGAVVVLGQWYQLRRRAQVVIEEGEDPPPGVLRGRLVVAAVGDALQHGAERAGFAGFGSISVDNRRVLVQEWPAEAITMWTFATLVVVVTAVGSGTAVADRAYRVTAGALLVLAVFTSSLLCSPP